MGNKCHLCGWGLADLECGMIKVKRWPNDSGVWECTDCRESSQKTENLDLEDYEEKKRRRIQEENEY